MIVDSSVFGELGSQFWRKNIREVQVLDGNLCRGLFGNQAGYLRPPGRVDIGRREPGGTEGRDVDYVSFIFWIKCCSCKLFLTY